MFESIVSSIRTALRNAVRGLGATTRTAPLLTAAAIMTLFFFM